MNVWSEVSPLSAAGTPGLGQVCMTYLGTEPGLMNFDYVLLPCALRPRAHLNVTGAASLPGNLQAELKFLPGLDLALGAETQAVPILEGSVLVMFNIPAGADSTHLVVLNWNGTAWKEVKGAHVLPNGYVTALTKRTGLYVLAQEQPQ